ncbi:MAG TPA: hypothetical protein VF708_06785 [Pyrinomonadaceae bacterium]|jgi:cytochrome c-type biogenesis protein CcmH/NrfG
MLRPIPIAVIALCSLAALLFCACAGTSSNTNQMTASNASTQSATPSPSISAPPASAAQTPVSGSGGEPIDTAKYDAEIKRLEKQAGMRPGDDASRLALAKAYLARGNALTQAKQYRAALGDYRRALRYDPDNEEARQWAAMITGIIQQMGREVPTEGNEPPPLPMTPDTIAGDDDESPTKEPKSNKKAGSNKQ